MTNAQIRTELRLVLHAWLRGEGPLIPLLVAWFEVITGRVVVDEITYPLPH